MAEDSTTSLTASALKFYPQSAPADLEVHERLRSLWSMERGFVVLSGPPGVGKTRATEDFITSMLQEHSANHGINQSRVSILFPDYQTNLYADNDIDQRLTQLGVTFVWDICVLHPQYSYEDLIRGNRLGANDQGTPTVHVREGLLGFMSRVVDRLDQVRAPSPVPSGVLILDEINRAAIGQLFGEALYALDRRGQSVATPHFLEGYGSEFTIPKSIFILGTMNSVDRAISGFDFALKRRFVTLNMGSHVQPIENRYQSSSKLKRAATSVFQQVSIIVTSAAQTGAVPTTELAIGHSFFLAPQTLTADDEMLQWFVQSMQFQIIPTLVDYNEQGLLRYDASTLNTFELADFITGTKPLSNLSTTIVKGYLASVLGEFVTDASDDQ